MLPASRGSMPGACGRAPHADTEPGLRGRPCSKRFLPGAGLAFLPSGEASAGGDDAFEGGGPMGSCGILQDCAGRFGLPDAIFAEQRAEHAGEPGSRTPGGPRRGPPCRGLAGGGRARRGCGGRPRAVRSRDRRGQSHQRDRQAAAGLAELEHVGAKAGGHETTAAGDRPEDVGAAGEDGVGGDALDAVIPGQSPGGFGEAPRAQRTDQDSLDAGSGEALPEVARGAATALVVLERTIDAPALWRNIQCAASGAAGAGSRRSARCPRGAGEEPGDPRAQPARTGRQGDLRAGGVRRSASRLASAEPLRRAAGRLPQQFRARGDAGAGAASGGPPVCRAGPNAPTSVPRATLPGSAEVQEPD